VLKIVLRVQGEVVLERPDRILCLLVRLCALRALRAPRRIAVKIITVLTRD
jgi:hypothetical protein